METNFFQNIAALGTPGKWNITIATQDNINFVVSAHFTAPHGNDNAASLIPPLMFKNTAEVLGVAFFRDIAEPIKETAEVFNNMEAYKKGLELARQKSQEQRDKNKPQPTTAIKVTAPETEEEKLAKEEKKCAYEEAMKTVASYLPQMKYAEALQILPLTEDYPDKKIELTAKREELDKLVKLKEKSLFAFNS